MNRIAWSIVAGVLAAGMALSQGTDPKADAETSRQDTKRIEAVAATNYWIVVCGEDQGYPPTIIGLVDTATGRILQVNQHRSGPRPVK